MLPILWYIFDHSYMQKVPPAVMFQNSHLFRILGLNHTATIAAAAPTLSDLLEFVGQENNKVPSTPLACTRLIDLRVSGYEQESLNLVRVNPELQRLHWNGPEEFRLDDVPMLEPDLLQGLSNLKSLTLCEWNLGRIGTLLRMLEEVQHTLISLTLDTISGGEGQLTSWSVEDGFSGYSAQDNILLDNDVSTATTITTTLPRFKIRSLSLNLQFSQSFQLLDLVRLCPELESLTLIAAFGADLDRLSQNLQEHCPRLQKIHIDGLYFGLFDTYAILPDIQFATLIQSTLPSRTTMTLNHGHNSPVDGLSIISSSTTPSTSQQQHRPWSLSPVEDSRRGLIDFKADIYGFEPLITQALIQSGPTLQSLHLSIHHVHSTVEDVARTNVLRDQAEFRNVLQACPNLRQVTIEYDPTLVSDPDLFTIDPEWQSTVKIVIASPQY
ncbi:hypothetical protein BGZ83_008336 [Gryganskiella cystojenkinii]|nr:hypothetical protein BGZ83_008336 [Gryganskiella cystojenkinii]